MRGGGGGGGRSTAGSSFKVSVLASSSGGGGGKEPKLGVLSSIAALAARESSDASWRVVAVNGSLGGFLLIVPQGKSDSKATSQPEEPESDRSHSSIVEDD